MDPLTAAALAIKAIAEMVTAIVEGQTPAFREKVGEWAIRDISAIRKALKLDA